MFDAGLTQTTKGYDINIANGDIEAIDNFKTAIEVSLFSDARANADQVFLPQYRRGWIGDVTSPINDQKFGSLLWLVKQERLTQRTLNKAVTFCREALQWFVDQGIARRVEVSGSIQAPEGISLNITITTLAGNVENHYVELWENTKNAD